MKKGVELEMLAGDGFILTHSEYVWLKQACENWKNTKSIPKATEIVEELNKILHEE